MNNFDKALLELHEDVATEPNPIPLQLRIDVYKITKPKYIQRDGLMNYAVINTGTLGIAQMAYNEASAIIACRKLNEHEARNNRPPVYEPLNAQFIPRDVFDYGYYKGQ